MASYHLKMRSSNTGGCGQQHQHAPQHAPQNLVVFENSNNNGAAPGRSLPSLPATAAAAASPRSRKAHSPQHRRCCSTFTVIFLVPIAVCAVFTFSVLHSSLTTMTTTADLGSVAEAIAKTRQQQQKQTAKLVPPSLRWDHQTAAAGLGNNNNNKKRDAKTASREAPAQAEATVADVARRALEARRPIISFDTASAASSSGKNSNSRAVAVGGDGAAVFDTDAGSQPRDSSGTPIPWWKRFLLAKQAATKTLQHPELVARPAAPMQLLPLPLHNAASNSTNNTNMNDNTNNNTNNNSNNRPVMAIVTSTRSIPNHTKVESTLLSQFLVKSISKTVSETELRFWTVRLYVAVDADDAWWQRHHRELQTPPWLAVTFGVFAKRGHHIPFSEMALVAYGDGADYFCRVNDDSEFVTGEWITLAVAALQQYDPPNLGVVGPTCSQGNTKILTHDMVHSTHMEIFDGNYYPPAFHNWYLDDWMSSVYSDLILGPHFHRMKVLGSWKVKHWMYKSRYQQSEAASLWLPVEYERGRQKITSYLTEQHPDHVVVVERKIASELPRPQRADPKLVEAVLRVLPPDGNLLVWGLDQDSQFWHRATTGRVTFLEEHNLKKKFDRLTWFNWIGKKYPYLEAFQAKFSTPRGDPETTYRLFVQGQTLESSNNWCDLELPQFPDSVRETFWDVILVDAPVGCCGAKALLDDEGAGAFQPLYMSKVLAANQTGRALNASRTAVAGDDDSQSSKRVTHIFVDDYERKYEREFSAKLFAKEPEDVLVLKPADRFSLPGKEIAHFVIGIHDAIAVNPQPYCVPPAIRDLTLYPKKRMGHKQVTAIFNALPKDGNMLIWGLEEDCKFWHDATQGRVIFLEDGNGAKREDGTTNYDVLTKKHPELEVYRVNYSTQNSEAAYDHFVVAGHPDQWSDELAMNASSHNLPDAVREIQWNVILVDGPLGCCSTGPGRFQSLYMSKIMAKNTLVGLAKEQQQAADGGGNEDRVMATTKATHIFVDDYERQLENAFSKLVFDKEPSEAIKKVGKGDAGELGHFVFEPSDFLGNGDLHTRVTKSLTIAAAARVKTDVVRDRSDFSEEAQMGWGQVENILRALPENGNLLVWGLGHDSPFWDRSTTGRVTFLDDGDWSGNLIDGKRWFDHMREKHPELEAYTLNYTTKNNAATYAKFMSHPENWERLKFRNFPPAVLETRWDVILVDAPLGCCDSGPARYQSIYMTKLLVRGSQPSPVKAVHVFVDDYERKVEKEFSRQVFGKAPIEVAKRDDGGASNANEQAHFVFGGADTTASAFENEISEDDDVTAALVPWSYAETDEAQAATSPLSSPDSWIILLEVNDGYFDFFQNWLVYFHALDNAGIHVVIMAEDDIVQKKLEKLLAEYPDDFTIERTDLELDAKAFGYDTSDYKMMVSARATHILGKLQAGLNVIYSDIDTVWRSSPLPYLAATDKADMIIQVDTGRYNGVTPYYCTGFMAIVSNTRTKDFMEDWRKALEKPQLNQPIFNDILHKRSSVRHQPLPKAEFPSGKHFFDQFSDDERGKAVIVHNNYIEGHGPKKERFQKHDLWKLITDA